MRLKIFEKEKDFVEDYGEILEQGAGADKCVRCGKCMRHCPQMIEIPNKLAMVHALYLEKKAELEAAEAAR